MPLEPELETKHATSTTRQPRKGKSPSKIQIQIQIQTQIQTLSGRHLNNSDSSDSSDSSEQITTAFSQSPINHTDTHTGTHTNTNTNTDTDTDTDTDKTDRNEHKHNATEHWVFDITAQEFSVNDINDSNHNHTSNHTSNNEDFFDSPSVWDPEDLRKQTSNLDSWKQKEQTPQRIQDLPSPLLVELESTDFSFDNDDNKQNNSDDEWPFKSPCSFQTKNRAKLASPHSQPIQGMSSPSASESDSSTSGSDDDHHNDNDNVMTKQKEESDHPSSEDHNDHDNHQDDNGDIDSDGDADNKGNKDGTQEAWKMRESWKGNSDKDKPIKNGSKEKSDHSDKRRPRRHQPKDLGPSKPKRATSIRPDSESTDQDVDKPPLKPKNRQDKDQTESEAPRSRRSASRKPAKQVSSTSASASSVTSDSIESTTQNEEGLDSDSFHQLVQDSDKPKSKSRERKSRSARSGRRRQPRDADTSPNDDADSEFYEEVVAVETEQGHDAEDKPTSESTRRSKPWRERRAANRLTKDGTSGSSHEKDGEVADTDNAKRLISSAGRRSSRHSSDTKQSHSERWRNNVEGDFADDGETIQRRARASLVKANAELSRSSHSGKRQGPRRGAGLGVGTRSFHEMSSSKRRPRSKSIESLDTGSFHDDSHENHESNEGSGRSRRTLDSIEDLEDFEHIDFQTPGMIDYDEELFDLMQRANPEDTAQLNRRVHRQRDRLEYDQNMPMMTKQALMTRQGSTQVSRQRFDASDMDKKRMLLRNDSMNSSASSSEDISRSQHRLRGTPSSGRRAPPRTRSSGLAGLSGSAMKRQPNRHEDGPDRRQLFRTRSSNTHSFQQYLNKPNKVAQLSRRTPTSTDSIDRHSLRGASSSTNPANIAAAKDRRVNLQRAKSTTALKKTSRTDAAKNDSAHAADKPADAESRLVSPDPAVSKSSAKASDQVSADVSAEVSAELKSSTTTNKVGSDAVVSRSSSKSNEQPEVVVESKVVADSKPKEEEPDRPSKSATESAPVPKAEPPKQRPAQVSPRKPPKRTKSVPVRPTPVVSPVLKRKAKKRDMSKKSHRQVLHAMMYEDKMSVTMKDLFKKVKKGSKPRDNPLMITAP